MSTRILCLNRGSSSLKFAVYDVDPGERRQVAGTIEGIGGERGRLRIDDPAGRTLDEREGRFVGPREVADAVLGRLERLGFGGLAAVSHRLVHGGPERFEPQRVDRALLEALRDVVPFAPLHLPAEIDLIREIGERLAGVPQVVCFDTGFHRHMPEAARRLPLGRAHWEAGVRRYGFHGLSYESVVDHVGAEGLGRAVIAHLGNGASLAAVRGGVSLDTTMGFTPTGGCLMGTRSGDLDPGVLIHLMRHHGYDAAALDREVNRAAGLLGLSETTSDMRALLAERAHDPRADLAIRMFCDSVRKHAGALATVLGGLDTLVFTGGIGERAAPVRAEICRGLEHLGARLEVGRNERNAEVISPPDARCTVRVVAADEERMLARHAARVLS